MADIVIKKTNSPFEIAGGSVSYGKVTILPDGFMVLRKQTTLTMDTMLCYSDPPLRANKSRSSPRAAGRKASASKKKK